MQEERRIQDYISGRLSAAEAAAFEAQMFEDDELGAEVERALEIRAAMQSPTASPAVTARRGTARFRPAWAMAAGVVAVGIGLAWFVSQPEAPVYRGVEQTMSLEVVVERGKLIARWAPAPGAKSYELQTFAADGQPIGSVTAAGTATTMELPGVEAPPASVEVVALDDFGQTLQRSQRVRLDADGAGR